MIEIIHSNIGFSPAIFCDCCRNRIDNVKDGIVIFGVYLVTDSIVEIRNTFFVHKGKCNQVLSKHHRDMGYMSCWMPIKNFVRYLSRSFNDYYVYDGCNDIDINNSFLKSFAANDSVANTIFKITQFAFLYGCESLGITYGLSNISSSSGIYFLWRFDGELDYIGKSRNIKSRLSNHHVFHRDRHIIGIVPVSDEQVRTSMEIGLIGLLAPRLNQKWRFDRIEGRI